MSHTLIVIISSVLMLPGIVGILVPVLPGIPYMFVVALIAALIEKFWYLTTSDLFVLGIIAAASMAVDYFSGILGARFGGASKSALYYGFIGLIIGLVLFPPFGGLVGLFVGIYLSETAQKRSRGQAAKAATGGVIGSVAGMVINLALSLLFLVLFIIFVLR